MKKYKRSQADALPIGDRLLTLREEAEVLRLSPRTLREQVSRGEIEGRIIGGRWRFRRADLDAFFAKALRNWDFAGKNDHADQMVSRGRTYPRYRCGGRFFGRRVNCEQVPLLPAWAVRRVLDDPRKIPYLFVWKSHSDGTVQEAVRIASHKELDGLGGLDWTGAVEIKRHDGTRNFIRTLLSPLPRNGGRVRFLICPGCQVPRRGLHGWEPGGKYTHSAVRSDWACRKCSMLRYASEGGALVHRSRGTLFRMIDAAYGPCRSPRPELWLPYVFASPEEAAEVGVCELSSVSWYDKR